MLMYSWDAVPSAPVKLSGVSDRLEGAQAAAASALLGSRDLAAVTVTEVRAVLTRQASVYAATGRTWTGYRGNGGGVSWTAAERLAS